MWSFTSQICQTVKVWQSLSATANWELSWIILGNLGNTLSVAAPKRTKCSTKHVITDAFDIMKAQISVIDFGNHFIAHYFKSALFYFSSCHQI